MELLLKTQEESTLMSFSALGSGCGASKDRHEGLSSKDPIRVSLAGDGTVGEELFAVPRSLDPYGSNERGGAHARIDRVESRFLTMQPSISTEAGAAGR